LGKIESRFSGRGRFSGMCTIEEVGCHARVLWKKLVVRPVSILTKGGNYWEFYS